CSHRITSCTSFQVCSISTGLGVALSIPAIRQLGRTHFFGSSAGSSLTNGQYQCSHRITACTSFQGSGISTGLGVALSIPAIRQLGRKIGCARCGGSVVMYGQDQCCDRLIGCTWVLGFGLTS